MTGVHTLDRLVEVAPSVQGVREQDLCAGDWLVVRTKNSEYVLSARGDGRFAVSGGWFATHVEGAASVGINGCTWGRRAILTGVVAAPGMCIEFDNGVRTTRIREVRLIRHRSPAVH